jgi:hypothetical protein
VTEGEHFGAVWVSIREVNVELWDEHFLKKVLRDVKNRRGEGGQVEIDTL